MLHQLWGYELSKCSGLSYDQLAASVNYPQMPNEVGMTQPEIYGHPPLYDLCLSSKTFAVPITQEQKA